MKMLPLKITWGLSTPLVTTGNPIHLDALVAYAKTAKSLREASLVSDVPHGLLVRELANELPLGKETRGQDWVWQASVLRPLDNAPSLHGMRFWTRRTDSYDIARRTGLNQFETMTQRGRRLAGEPEKPPKALKPYAMKIDTVRGIDKNMYKFYPTKTLSQVQAWCIGNLSELHDLLAPEAGYITHIGPRKRSGHGQVCSFEIIEDEQALTHWSNRVLPSPHDGAVEMSLATQPPYWAPENRRASFVNPAIFV